VFDVSASALAAQIFTGLVLGGIFVLLAIGLSLIFGLMTVVNFAHGALYMLGAYFGVFLLGLTKNFWLSLVVAPLMVFVLGLAIERVLVRPLYGRSIDIGNVAVHWELARMLLDFVKPPESARPAPTRDAMVRQWYRATVAWMEQHEDHEIDHVDRAHELFPDDPDVLFLTACMHETFASPHMQSAVRSAVVPSGFSFGLGSDRAELRKAEGLFRRAIAARPQFAEARLRLGRVLTLLGQATPAAAELRKAIDSTNDPLLLYYGHLFLGAAQEALSRFDEARAAYERALALRPTHVDAHVNLGRLLHEAHELRLAEEHYRAALALQPSDVTALFNLGVLMEDQQKAEESLSLYEEATRLVVADSPDIWVYNTVEIRGVADRVKDFKFSPVGSGGEMRWIKLAN